MEKQPLLGGSHTQPLATQRHRTTSKSALFIAITAFCILSFWRFFLSYGRPWDNSVDPELREYEGESLQWHLCGDVNGQDLECSSVDVPMDQFNKTKSGDKVFQIPLIRLRGKPGSKNLLINPGGPGGSGVSWVYDVGAEIRSVVGEDLHIIGFDPRGINSSTPKATCYVDEGSRQELRPRRRTDLIRDSPYLYAWSTNYVRACHENAGELFKYVNTPQTAADMNTILDALGQDGMFYWGVSYGSLLGQVYATIFPERSERVVIDGVVDQSSWFEAPLDNSRYIDSWAVVDGFFEECVRSGHACPLSKYGKTGPELRENVTRVIDSLYRHPASVYVDGSTYGVVDDFDARIRTLWHAMYSPADWPALAEHLAQLQEGNATGIFLSSVRRTVFDDVPEGNVVVTMNDGQSGPSYWPQTQMDLLEKLLPYFDKFPFAVGDMIDFHLKQQWTISKTHSYAPKTKVETANPLLILSTLYDPVCPYVAAQEAQKRFVGSRLVAIDAYGHASIAKPSLCAAKYMQKYLVNGSLPDKDVVCQSDGAYFPDSAAAADVRHTTEEQDLMAAQAVLANKYRSLS